jgi:hypothetical protein
MCKIPAVIRVAHVGSLALRHLISDPCFKPSGM